MKRTFTSLICLRCGHGGAKTKQFNGRLGDEKLWWPRDPGKLPAHCPVCQSPYWMKNKKEIGK